MLAYLRTCHVYLTFLQTSNNLAMQLLNVNITISVYQLLAYIYTWLIIRGHLF